MMSVKKYPEIPSVVGVDDKNYSQGKERPLIAMSSISVIITLLTFSISLCKQRM